MNKIITPYGALALHPGTIIDISKNNPLFTRAEEFSVSISVPRIPNEAIFRYQYRLANANSPGIIDAQFFFYGREKMSGSIELISATDNAYEIRLKGSRSYFIYLYGQDLLSELPVSAYFPSEEYFVPDVASPTDIQITDEMVATTISHRDWICIPVWDEDKGAWINEWNFSKNCFADAGVMPSRTAFLKLHVLLERLFASKGYVITDNWFTVTQERKNIVLYNAAGEIGSRVRIREMLPKWKIIDLLNNLEDFFPVTLLINTHNKTVRIVTDDDIAMAPPEMAIDKFITGKPKILFSEKQDGYELKYDLPQNDDSIKSDWEYTDEITDTNSVANYHLLSTAYALSIPARVISDGQFYKSQLTDGVVTWEKCGNLAQSMRSGKGDITRETKIYPLMNKTLDITQDFTALREDPYSIIPIPVKYQIQVPSTNKVNGAGWNEGLWRQDFRVMVFRGYDPIWIDSTGTIPPGYALLGGSIYPMANYVARHMSGEAWESQSLELRWDTDKGLGGAKTLSFLQGAKKVTATMLMHHMDLEKIDMTKVYTLQGQKMIISELVIHYGSSENVAVDATFLIHVQ